MNELISTEINVLLNYYSTEYIVIKLLNTNSL